MVDDDERARLVALSIIRRGLLRPSEITRFMAVSRVTVFRWVKAARIDADACRATYAAKIWEIESAAKTTKPGSRKQRARTRAEAATETYLEQGHAITVEPAAMPKFSQHGQAQTYQNPFKAEVLLKLRAGTMTIEQAARRAKVKVSAICGWCRLHGIALPEEYNQPRRPKPEP